MTRPILSALVLFTFVACDKASRKAPPAPVVENTPKTPPKKKKPAPKGVPQELHDMVEAGWPAIEAFGDTFVAEFNKATKAKAANDRDTMDTAVAAASKAYRSAVDKWAEIAYWPTNTLDDDAQIESCDRYLRKWEKKFKGWTKKSKALAQFQRAK